MSLAIAGMGWVTPLGNNLAEVWRRLLNGEVAIAQSIESPLGQTYAAFKVSDTPGSPSARLRRSSAISHFAVRAGLAALENSQLSFDSTAATRTALILAISNGGVIYTRRFYDEIVEKGPRAASPLLFPETVFNAPASHLAAILGVTGVSYTVVGDGAVGIMALKMAEQLMDGENLDHCLVIAAEENDWLLCDAYQKWRFLRPAPPIEPFQTPPKGTILSEGAGALLLSRNGPVEIQKIVCGPSFAKRSHAKDSLAAIFSELGQGKTDLVVASAGGAFVDAAERFAVSLHCSNVPVVAIKAALGESVGASSLWQTICGAQSLITQSVPSKFACSLTRTAGAREELDDGRLDRVMISACGLNQQAAGLCLIKT